MSQKPKQYVMLTEKFPKSMQALEDLGIAAAEEGPLDEKAAQLIKLGAAAAQRSEGGVHSHVRRALAAGASAEEIRHALMLLASTIGFPQVSAAMSWASDILDA